MESGVLLRAEVFLLLMVAVVVSGGRMPPASAQESKQPRVGAVYLAAIVVREPEASADWYRAKTGNRVYVPLPPDVADALRNIPPGPSPNPRYFFWSGNGSPKSVVGNWQRSFRRLFKIANLRRDDGSPKRCDPHMFRDTFAVEMLLAGVPQAQIAPWSK